MNLFKTYLRRLLDVAWVLSVGRDLDELNSELR